MNWISGSMKSIRNRRASAAKRHMPKIANAGRSRVFTSTPYGFELFSNDDETDEHDAKEGGISRSIQGRFPAIADNQSRYKKQKTPNRSVEHSDYFRLERDSNRPGKRPRVLRTMQDEGLKDVEAERDAVQDHAKLVKKEYDNLVDEYSRLQKVVKPTGDANRSGQSLLPRQFQL